MQMQKPAYQGPSVHIASCAVSMTIPVLKSLGRWAVLKRGSSWNGVERVTRQLGGL